MKYFTLNELCKSNYAISHNISNIPSEDDKFNLTLLVEYILDPLREAWGRPILVNSGYRSLELNTKLGGAKNSQHLTGSAADIQTVSDSKEDNKRLFDLIVSLNLPFDLLIDECDYSWIHVSYSDKHRRQILHL